MFRLCMRIVCVLSFENVLVSDFWIICAHIWESLQAISWANMPRTNSIIIWSKSLYYKKKYIANDIISLGFCHLPGAYYWWTYGALPSHSLFPPIVLFDFVFSLFLFFFEMGSKCRNIATMNLIQFFFYYGKVKWNHCQS